MDFVLLFVLRVKARVFLVKAKEEQVSEARWLLDSLQRKIDTELTSRSTQRYRYLPECSHHLFQMPNIPPTKRSALATLARCSNIIDLTLAGYPVC